MRDPATEPLFETWAAYDRDTAPVPSVFAECRTLADDSALVRVINRLGFKGRLPRYSLGRKFVCLVKRLSAAEAV